MKSKNSESKAREQSRRRPYTPPAIESEEMLQGAVMACGAAGFDVKGQGLCVSDFTLS